MTDAIHSDQIITPSIVLDQQLWSMDTTFDDLIRDFAKPGNEARFIDREEEFFAIARKATELALSIRYRKWANRSAAA